MQRLLAVLTSFVLAFTVGVTPAFAAVSGPTSRFASVVQLQLTPTYQQVPLGYVASWTLTWSDEPYFNQLFVMHFGDGNQTSYKCWSNCTTGSQIFGYNGYPNTGLWGAWATDQNFNGSNLADVRVY